MSFRLATPDDDAGLRRLLRDTPMAGDVQLSLEREPSYFAAAAIEGPVHRTVVAVEDGRIVCAGGVSARLRYVNGRPAWVGYLGGLRLAAGCRNRTSIVRGGYALFRQLHEQGWVLNRAINGIAPSPGTPGEGWGGGLSHHNGYTDDVTPVSERTREDPDKSDTPVDVRCPSGSSRGTAQTPASATTTTDSSLSSASGPLPSPPPEYRGRGQNAGLRSPAVYLTSIVADNLAARRLLERGLPGMPTYHFVGELVTLVIRRRRNGEFYKPTAKVRGRLGKWGLNLQYGSDSLVTDLVALLNRHGAGHQFAPVWTPEDLAHTDRCLGLSPADFRLVRSADGAAVACAAFWDQRASKQTVVRGYAPRIGRSRLLLNVGLALAGRPTLPRVGRQLAHAFVSHLAADVSRPAVVEQLVWLLHGPACTRRVDYLTLGLDARDPRLPHLRRTFRPREYRSRLYAVHWDDAGAAVARSLDGRLLAPEVALL